MLWRRTVTVGRLAAVSNVATGCAGGGGVVVTGSACVSSASQHHGHPYYRSPASSSPQSLRIPALVARNSSAAPLLTYRSSSASASGAGPSLASVLGTSPSSSSSGGPTSFHNSVLDIGYHVVHNNGKLPLGKIIHHVSAATKLAVFKSSKGIEGYIRSHAPHLNVQVGSNNEKFVVVTSKELEDWASKQTSPPTFGGGVIYKSAAETLPASKGGGMKPSAASAADPPPPMPASGGSMSSSASPPQAAAAAVASKATAAPKANLGFTAATQAPSPVSAATGTPMMQPVSAPAGTPDVAGANPVAESQELAKAPSPVAAAATTTTSSPSVPTDDEDKKDPNYILRKRLSDVLMDATKYYNLNEVFTLLYKSSTQVKYADMLAYVKASEKWFWYQKGHVARRLPGQDEMPPFVVAPLAKPKSSAAGKADVAVTAADNFGGWGAQANIPTAEDIYEVLKYVPIHWVEVGHLTMPKDIRKKHVRISSIVVWFERQPRYFELRLVGGSIEVRRSIVLHPEAHQLTKEQAEEILAKRLAEKKESIVQQMQDFIANRGKVKAEALANVTAGSAASSRVVMPSAMSAQLEAVLKLVVRVCPGYPIPISQILRRSSKKSITVDDILQCLPSIENQIDRIDVVTEKGERGLFLRKKTGVDLANWKEQFISDVSKATNLSALMSLMTLSCAQWDRTHFLYVRLTDDEKVAVEGFDGMVAMLRAHPFVFKTGEYFYRRHNPSDPLSEGDPEPTSNTQSSTVVLEENPYHNTRDLAVVFHYLTPDDQPCSLSHFVESSSPAMRAVLPPRLVTVVHAHPELFTCREITPGQYSIAKKTAADDPSAQNDAAASLSREEVVQHVIKLVPVRGIDIGHLNNGLPPALRNAVTRCFGASGLSGLVASYPQYFHVVNSPPYTTIFLKH